MKFVKSFLLVATALSLNVAFGQEGNDPILLKFNDDEVRLSEFKAVYEKNNSNNQIAKSTPEEYLDLYVKFKLKVKQALEMQLDTNPAFIQELKGYRGQLAQPYLTDEKTKERLKKETYERLQSEVKASHILITVDEGASAADTLAAYNKIKKLRQEVLNGADFVDVAVKNSQDPSVKSNKGDLGYFTAMHMVYPFEKAAYETAVGDVSPIVRTSYGYHIIQVNDKRPARGEIKVAHILVRYNTNAEIEAAKAAGSKEIALKDPEGKINEIYQKLESGTSFEELARLYSEDKKTANQGGVLPKFGTGKMIQPFEDFAFDLKNDGDYSEPFKTQFGYHIVKRLEVYPTKSYDEMESKIEKNMSRDAKKMYTTDAVVARLKKEYNFSEMKNNLSPFYTLGKAFEDKKWDGEGIRNRSAVMATFADQKITNQDFIDFLIKRTADYRQIDRKSLINKNYNDFINETMLAYEDTQLERKYPEFKALVKEYHDGILLFELTEKMVWNKAIVDTAGLEGYYEENISSYQWPERLEANIYLANSEKVAKQTYKLVKKREKNELTPLDIQSNINEASQLNLELEQGKYAAGSNKFIQNSSWVVGVKKPIELDGKFAVVEVLDVLPPGPKTIKEIRGQVTSDYQDYLEKQWVSSLESKYPVEIYREQLKLIEE